MPRIKAGQANRCRNGVQSQAHKAVETWRQYLGKRQRQNQRDHGGEHGFARN